ncbi:MAG: putative inorganic carbon transporter subunit DabA, partial [Acidiferrobacter sp.]
MTLTLGDRLKVRAMVYVASEPIPRFWPMRTFIHHNPLYGLEGKSFPEAVAEGSRLFHARGYLERSQYQRYRREGKVDDGHLRRRIADFLASRADVSAQLDLEAWLWHMATACKKARSLEG